jgi:ribosomal protein L28
VGWYNTVRMAVCAICSKGSVMGISQRHGRGVAGKRWKKRAQETPRIFHANLQAATLMVGDKEVKVKLCTKCIKKQKKAKAN